MRWPKKCPECGSTRITADAVTFKCNRPGCGYSSDLRIRPLEFKRYKKKE